jgi:hypothetical protein
MSFASSSRACRWLDQDVDERLLHLLDLARLDLDVRRLTAGAAERLVDHHARVREGEATPF